MLVLLSGVVSQSCFTCGLGETQVETLHPVGVRIMQRKHALNIAGTGHVLNPSSLTVYRYVSVFFLFQIRASWIAFAPPPAKTED